MIKIQLMSVAEGDENEEDRRVHLNCFHSFLHFSKTIFDRLSLATHSIEI